MNLLHFSKNLVIVKLPSVCKVNLCLKFIKFNSCSKLLPGHFIESRSFMAGIIFSLGRGNFFSLIFLITSSES